MTCGFEHVWSWAGRHSTGPQRWQSVFGVTATLGGGQIHLCQLFNRPIGLSVDLVRQCHLQSFAWVPPWQAGSNRWLLNWGATTCLSTRLDGMLDAGGKSIWMSHNSWRSRFFSFDDFVDIFCIFFEQIWPMGNNPRRVKSTWPDNLTRALVPWRIHTWRIQDAWGLVTILRFFHKKTWEFQNSRLATSKNLKRPGWLCEYSLLWECTPDSTGRGNRSIGNPSKEASQGIWNFQFNNSALFVAWNHAFISFMFSKDVFDFLESVNALETEGGYSLGKFLPGLCILPWRLYAARQSLGQIQVGYAGYGAWIACRFTVCSF